MDLQRLKDFFIEEALPKWAVAAYDERHGQFMESLKLDGTPETTGIVRTRTAARLIYVYAHATVLGVAPAGSLQKAERAFANLHRVTWNAGARPGYARAFNRLTDAVTDPERDLYDNACVLLALAWLLKATGRRRYREQIEAAIAAIDQTLGNPGGGWAEDSLGTLPRRQNPHMHYLEASLALCETGGNADCRQMADRLLTLFHARFFDGAAGPLRESFGPLWEVADRYRSDRLEPGHMCEWVWLVRRHAVLTGQKDSPLCAALLATGLAVGRFEGSIFLLDEVLADGTPLSSHRRLWPQVEMLKAFLMQHRALGDEAHRLEAEAVAAALFASYFSEAPAGCWHDALDLEGKPVAKTIPASSLYHLWTAVAELLDKTDAHRLSVEDEALRLGIVTVRPSRLPAVVDIGAGWTRSRIRVEWAAPSIFPPAGSRTGKRSGKSASSAYFE
ncbi:N-acylglucosamine 2-epimerase [Rhizobium sp. KAs_5_22]|uniref:AGE family epimerase/isomerase n=1 Tax=Ciceribacter selenitireducens TaxID=448181 RepID=UPI0004AE119D|nr:AGE family epimerase/isomerase [Ciceribacter selenitireducens]PPJ49046.1 N-acylglucosamine 2-epimerase [Rhizobium sp. KAs_5_22]